MTVSPEQRHHQDAQTLFAMGQIYCAAHHADAEKMEQGVCAECQEVIEYSLGRADGCPYGHSGNCQDCPIKCYKPEMKGKIKELMRYAAPRMIYRHPILTARYVRKKKPFSTR